MAPKQVGGVNKSKPMRRKRAEIESLSSILVFSFGLLAKNEPRSLKCRVSRAEKTEAMRDVFLSIKYFYCSISKRNSNHLTYKIS